MEILRVQRDKVLNDIQALQDDIAKIERKLKIADREVLCGQIAVMSGLLGFIANTIVHGLASSQENAQATQMIAEMIEAGGIQQINQAVAELTEFVNSNVEGATVQIAVAVNTVLERSRSLADTILTWGSLALSLGGALSIAKGMTSKTDNIEKLRHVRAQSLDIIEKRRLVKQISVETKEQI